MPARLIPPVDVIHYWSSHDPRLLGRRSFATRNCNRAAHAADSFFAHHIQAFVQQVHRLFASRKGKIPEHRTAADPVRLATRESERSDSIMAMVSCLEFLRFFQFASPHNRLKRLIAYCFFPQVSCVHPKSPPALYQIPQFRYHGRFPRPGQPCVSLFSHCTVELDLEERNFP